VKLTREQIENMPAGREMDALVAEHVMGWKWYTSVASAGRLKALGVKDQHFYGDGWSLAGSAAEPYVDALRHVPRYSVDIFNAWEVVDHQQGGLRFELRRRPDGGFWCSFGERMSAEAESAPLAICRAALLSRLS
jgi:hypothetical protein